MAHVAPTVPAPPPAPPVAPEEPEPAPSSDRGTAWWLAKGFWAVMDQALFAGTNFAMNVLLARWMEPAAFGAFATAQAIYVLLVTFHHALLTEPMLVFGANQYKDRFRAYLGSLLVAHGGFWVLCAAVLLPVCVALYTIEGPLLSSAVLTLLIAQPCILLPLLMRKASYVVDRPRLATMAAALYMVVLLALLAVLYATEALSNVAAFTAMGIAGLLAGGAMLVALRPRRPKKMRDSALSEVVRRHWAYGRWSVGSSIMNWVPFYLWYLLLPIWLNLEANAALRALMNFELPVGHVFTALAVLLVPAFVRAHQEGPATLHRYALRALALFTGAALLYWLLLGFFGETLIGLLYDGKYTEQAPLLWLLGFAPIVNGAVVVTGSALLAQERPDLVFRGSVVSLIITALIGLPLVYVYGIIGVIGSLILANTGLLVTMIAMYWQRYTASTRSHADAI